MTQRETNGSFSRLMAVVEVAAACCPETSGILTVIEAAKARRCLGKAQLKRWTQNQRELERAETMRGGRSTDKLRNGNYGSWSLEDFSVDAKAFLPRL